MRRPISTALLLLSLVACRDDPVTYDEPNLGLDPEVPAAAGEARAGVVRDGGEAALFGGINAEGRAGDVKLYNALIQVVIQGAYVGHGFIPSGGDIIDADLVRAPDAQGRETLGRDTLEDQFLGFGGARIFEAQTVEILSDGGGGGDAVVCARGVDVPWLLMQSLVELDEPSIPDLGLEITRTYTLPPDSYTIAVETELVNRGDEAVTFTPQAGILASGEDLSPWMSGAGLEGPSSGEIPSLAFTGLNGEATIASWPVEGTYSSNALSAITAELGIAFVDAESITLAPGERAAMSQRWTVAPDPLRAEMERWAATGVETGAVSGTVSDPDGGVAGVRVHFVDGDGAVAGYAVTDAGGVFEGALPAGDWTAYAVARAERDRVELPAGAGRYGPSAAEVVNDAHLAALRGDADYAPLAWAVGRAEPAPVALQVAAGGSAEIAIDLEPAGWIDAQITDGGAPIPAVLDLQWSEGDPGSTVPEDLRDALGVPAGARAAWAWTADGEIAISAAPGTYTLTAGHSWRHEQATVEGIAVAAGETARANLALAEVVPDDGWRPMDPHLHAAPSFDAGLPMEDRLVTCAATGVALPVTTDHDRQAEYRGLVDAMGLSSRMQAIPGVEVTTFLRGHFNLYPVEPDPQAPNGGAPDWMTPFEDTEELFARMRATAGAQAAVQVNHPRGLGMFASGQYDPETGELDAPEYWSDDFEVFELLNGALGGLDGSREDWFSFLSDGRSVVPVGVSDSHYRYFPCGLARTDVYLGEGVTPGGLAATDVMDALLAGRVVVASGVTLRATMSVAGGAPILPGETGSGTQAAIDAKVSAPSWVAPGTLRVYQNGEVVFEQALTEAGDDGVWFDESIFIETNADAWFVVEVEGTEGQGDIWRGLAPYAAANAFFLDADGGGWAAPGL